MYIHSQMTAVLPEYPIVAERAARLDHRPLLRLLLRARTMILVSQRDVTSSHNLKPVPSHDPAVTCNNCNLTDPFDIQSQHRRPPSLLLLRWRARVVPLDLRAYFVPVKNVGWQARGYFQPMGEKIRATGTTVCMVVGCGCVSGARLLSAKR